MPIVDERVVEMRFDNKQFESGAQESIGTVEKLKNVLDFSSSTKSFDNLEKAADGVNFGGLGKAVETVKEKFSVLEVAALTAISNITNRAVDAGIRIAKSLSVDQIMSGFSEYELKMGSIQTIMASTGETLETVNGYLDELNHYADKTIYSFSDMTQNIGKFTNAGVKLDSAVKAIQGVSNVAAVSGANANEASRAMYNFAQALSSGAVKLIDWKSIENANMATVEFKQALLDTALAMGTVVKEGDKYRSTTTDNTGKISDLFDATHNFNDALKAQWMTTDVLVQTLSNYSTDIREMSKEEKFAYEEKLKSVGYTKEQIIAIEELGKKAFDSAQDVKTFNQLMDTLKESVGSGWAQTFEIIVGDFEEAKQLWTNVNNVIGDILQKQADQRNYILQVWKELGGRSELIESISNIWKAFLSVLTPIKEAFTDIFPPITANTLIKITENLKEFTEKLILSEETSNKIKRTFTGLFSLVDILGKAFGTIVKLLSPLIKLVGFLASNILTITAYIGDWITKLDDVIKKNQIFVTVLEAIQKPVKIAAEKMKEFITIVKEWVSSNFKSPNLSFITDFADVAEKRLSPLKVIFNVIGSVMAAVVGVFYKVTPVIVSLAKVAGNALSKFGGKIVETFNSGGIKAVFDLIFDLFNTGVIASIAISINKFIKSIGDLGDAFAGEEGFGKIKEAFVGTMEAIQSTIKADVLKKIATSIAILTASLLVLTLIDSEKLASSLATITGLFIDLFASMAIFSKIEKFKSSTLKMSSMMQTISISVVILSSALLILSKIDKDKIVSSLSALTVIMAELSGVIILISKYGGKIKTGALSMIALASSVIILSKAVKDLGALDTEKLIKGLSSITVILSELALFMISAKFGKLKMSQATSLVILASSMLILQNAVASFGKLNTDKLIKGLSAFTAVLSELVLFMISAKFGKLKMSQATSLVILASSMLIFQKAISDFGSLDTKVILKGLSVLTTIISELALVNVLLSKFGGSKHMIGAATAMTIMAASMIILEEPMKTFGGMNLSDLAKGLYAIGISLAEMTLAANFMPKNMISIGLGIIEMSEAITLLSKSLISLSGMSWEEIARGLVALAGGLAEIVIVTKLMNSSLAGSASLLIVSAALLALVPVIKALGSLNWTEILTALATLAGIFTVLGAAGAILSPVVPAILGLSAALTLLSVGVAGLGAGLLLISSGLAALAVSGVAGATALVSIADILLSGLLNAIANSLDSIGRVVKNIVDIVCDVILESIPRLVDIALKTILETLNALIKYAPDIVKAVIDLIVAILNELTKNLPKLVDSIFDLIETLFSSVLDRLKKIDGKKMLESILSIGALSTLVVILAGIASMVPSAMAGALGLSAIMAELALLFSALGKITEISGLEKLIEKGGNLLKILGTAIGEFIGGIIGGFASGITSSFPKIAQDLSSFMDNIQPFIEGASKIDSKGMNGVKALVDVILLLTAANVLDGLTSWITGGSSLSKFGEDLAKFGPSFKQYYDTVKDIKPDVIEASANAAKALGEMAANLPNQGGIVSWFTGDNTLSIFAEELKPFGKAMAKYSEDVVSVKSDVVIASANAAKALGEMAANLPNQGGVVSWFVGDNTLSVFAEELKVFGPAIKEYGNSINGLNADVIKESANSAKVLSEMAANLPNQGGIVSWFTGDNTLSMFAEELKVFGPAIKQYGDSVNGLNESAVTGSANAAKALAAMAKDIPNTGGLVSWFTGDNDISAFGESLKVFGPAIKQYGDSVNGLNQAAVTGSTNAANVLVELAKSIPNTGGLVSWFTGDNDFKTFGDQLSSFGNSMAQYANSVNGVSENGLNNAINGAERLVEMAKKIDAFNNLTSLSSFSDQLKKLGEQGITGFTEAFKNSKATSEGSVLTFISFISEATKQYEYIVYSSFNQIGETAMAQLTSGMISHKSTPINEAKSISSSIYTTFKDTLNTNIFETIGSNAIKSIINGINNKQQDLYNKANTASSNIINIFKNNLQNYIFENIGREIIDSINTGIYINSYTVTSKIYDVCNNILTVARNYISNNDFKNIGYSIIDNISNGITDYSYKSTNSMYYVSKDILYEAINVLSYNEFKNIGKDICNGLVDGINSGENNVVKAAKKCADAAIKSAKMVLGIHSPSRVFTDMGENTTSAFSNSIINTIYKVINAGKKLATGFSDPVQYALDNLINSIENNDYNYDPTITPILDLSNIIDGTNQISSIFNGINATKTIDLANSASGGFYKKSNLYKETNNKELNDKLNQILNGSDISKTENTNTFYIQSTDPKKAAEEVSYIMQHKVERGKATWAK